MVSTLTTVLITVWLGRRSSIPHARVSWVSNFDHVVQIAIRHLLLLAIYAASQLIYWKQRILLIFLMNF